MIAVFSMIFWLSHLTCQLGGIWAPKPKAGNILSLNREGGGGNNVNALALRKQQWERSFRTTFTATLYSTTAKMILLFIISLVHDWKQKIYTGILCCSCILKSSLLDIFSLSSELEGIMHMQHVGKMGVQATVVYWQPQDRAEGGVRRCSLKCNQWMLAFLLKIYHYFTLTLQDWYNINNTVPQKCKRTRKTFTPTHLRIAGTSEETRTCHSPGWRCRPTRWPTGIRWRPGGWCNAGTKKIWGRRWSRWNQRPPAKSIHVGRVSFQKAQCKTASLDTKLTVKLIWQPPMM